MSNPFDVEIQMHKTPTFEDFPRGKVMLRVYREGKSLQLVPELLARHLRISGVVVFTSGRVRQRAIAREIKVLVHPEIEALDSETRSANDCMCVFDPERFSLREVLALASEADQEFEKDAARE